MIAVDRETTKTNDAVYGEHGEHAAATYPRLFESGTSRLSRWVLFVDTTRASNCSALYSTYVVTKGVHDAVGAWWFPDHLENLAVLNPTSLPMFTADVHRTLAFGGKVYRRLLLGPSSVGYSPENSTIQAVEDSFLSSDFWKTFGGVAAEVTRLGKLKRGWDSNGAHPINLAAQTNAIRFLGAVFAAGGRTQPAVGPSPNGAVVLQWFVRQREVFVEIDERQLDYFAAAVGETDLLTEGVTAVSRANDLARSLTPYM